MKINKITKKILLKDGLIIDPFKEKKFKGSILIENGFISKISNEISDEDCEVFDCKNLILSRLFLIVSGTTVIFLPNVGSIIYW